MAPPSPLRGSEVFFRRDPGFSRLRRIDPGLYAGAPLGLDLCNIRVEKRLKLQVNLEKSAVDRPWRRVLLGFTFVGRELRRRVSDKALKALRGTVKEKTRRTLGVSFRSLISGLSKTLLGWRSSYGFSEVPTPLQELEKWIRRRLRCYPWKQWGRRGYRELKRR